jgi:hypothetical protein
VLLGAAATAQSVAGVAKKNKDQAGEKKPRIVITDQTLKGGTPAASAEPAAAAPAAGAQTAPAGAASNKATDREKRQAELNQEYSGKYRKLFLDLKNAEARQQEAQSRYAWTSAASWQRKAKELREKMDALKEEGRKAGVEPGVFRQVEKNLERLNH